MLALLQASLPQLPLVERWRIRHRSKNWDRGFTETAIVGSRVVFVEETGRGKGAYGALDAATGKRLWSHPFAPELVNYLQIQGRYVTITGEKRLRVVDPTSGRAVWQGTHEGNEYDTLIADARLYVERERNVLTAIDLASGHPLWSVCAPLAYRKRTNFGHLTAIADTLWGEDSDGRVFCLQQNDGHALWTRSSSDGQVFSVLPTIQGILVAGPRSFELLNPRNGKTLWRSTSINGYGTLLYQPAPQQIWELPDDGRLVRVDAATGRQLSDISALAGGRGRVHQPILYQGGAIGYNGQALIRIDPQGRPTAQYDPQETVYDLHPFGRGLFLRTENGLVMLAPGEAPLPKDPAATAARLVAKPSLTPEDRRTLVRLGHVALPALIDATPKTYGDSGDALAELAATIADRRDSEAMIDLADRVGVFSDYGVKTRILGDWLTAHADHDALALRLLPRFVVARDAMTRDLLVPYLLQSSLNPVVDALLARLRAPETAVGTKALIYGGIAASGRKDVLDEILRLRATGRRLAATNPELTLRGDYDRDGVPDDLDANPFVSPCALDETERVLFALFDARLRFEERNLGLGIVDYGRGVQPFELVGWNGAVVPAELTGTISKQGTYARLDGPFGFIRFQPQDSTGTPVAFNADRTEATAGIAVYYGPLDGTGYEARLRKIRGEWFVVSLKMRYVS